ncbi:hypothetical protein D3C81_2209230 [compost metagenome]
MQKVNNSRGITAYSAYRDDAKSQRFRRGNGIRQSNPHIRSPDEQRVHILSGLKRLPFQLAGQLSPVKIHAEH